jgi:hypothetical protein
MNTSSYSNFTLERCIFTSCTGASYGGVLCLDYSSAFVIITSCRFENNSASSYGFDIYTDTYSCFSGYTPINSCTTSAVSQSVYCSEYKSILPSPCNEKIVCYCLLFINYFFIFLFTCEAWCYEGESCSDYCVRYGYGNEKKNYLFRLFMLMIRMGDECVLSCPLNYENTSEKTNKGFTCTPKQCGDRTPWSNGSCSMEEDFRGGVGEEVMDGYVWRVKDGIKNCVVKSDCPSGFPGVFFFCLY